jgi:hypothetical protein
MPIGLWRQKMTSLSLQVGGLFLFRRRSRRELPRVARRFFNRTKEASIQTTPHQQPKIDGAARFLAGD